MGEQIDRGAEVAGFATRLHAATAELCRRAADYDDSGAWRGVGLVSCAHWLSINAGYELWSAAAMLHVGHALRKLPLIAAAFAEGRLSYDKVRALVEVATPFDEQMWLEVALHATGSQLGKICRAFRRAIVSDDPDRATAQQRKRRLVTWWRDDGMLEIFATLPPEDAAIVLGAIETAMKPGALPAPVERLPADQPVAARRADAFVHICERWVSAKADAASPSRALPSLVVHVDVETLVDSSDGGRCHLEGGPALSAEAARRLGCDADVMAVVEREGVPITAGRNRRVVSGRMRRLLELRDGTCRYPGCMVPARDTEGHHIRHWIDGGATELSNLVSLCRYHHHRHHEGEFLIALDDGGTPRFIRADGTPIQPPVAAPGGAEQTRAWLRDCVAVERDGLSAAARDAGAPMDLEHAVWVLAHNTEVIKKRSGRSP